MASLTTRKMDTEPNNKHQGSFTDMFNFNPSMDK